MVSPPRLIQENGLRLDGRRKNELRPIKMMVGVLKRADGSAYVEMGDNRIMAAVYGPHELHPRHLQKPDRAVIRARYNMAAFSVEERKRPGPDRRSIEISKVMREALEPAIFEELYPRASIDIFVEVLQADAGTRTTGITAAALALADAGIPMRDLVAACAVGRVDGQIILDLNKMEDNYGEADMPIAIMPRKNMITLLQMDGHFTGEEFFEALELGIEGCKHIYQLQREALRAKYSRVGETIEAGDTKE